MRLDRSRVRGAVCLIIASASIAVAVSVVRGQSSAAATTASAKDWPTYGHDPGGMRFSPLTQITPANVAQLQVAWVYHMKPATPGAAVDGRAAGAGAGAGDAAAVGRANAVGGGAAGGGAGPGGGARGAGAAGGGGARGAAAGVAAPVGDTPDAAPAAGRGRGGRGGGFASSEVTPLVINGVMYIATPYFRVVAVDATTGKESVGVSTARRQPRHARRRVLAGRCAGAGADRVRVERRQALFD